MPIRILIYHLGKLQQNRVAFPNRNWKWESEQNNILHVFHSYTSFSFEWKLLGSAKKYECIEIGCPNIMIQLVPIFLDLRLKCLFVIGARMEGKKIHLIFFTGEAIFLTIKWGLIKNIFLPNTFFVDSARIVICALVSRTASGHI